MLRTEGDESLTKGSGLEDGEKWMNMAGSDLVESAGPGELLDFVKGLEEKSVKDGER